MKRIATLLLVFTTLFSLVACGGETLANDGVSDLNEAAENTVQTSISQAETTESEEIIVSEEIIENEITFDEMVAIDNEECSIKITGIDEDNMWGYTLNVLLENKSADKAYRFSVRDAAINGIQCDSLFAEEVAAGKKSNDEISFTDSKLEENGITEYTDIELTLKVRDSDDWGRSLLLKKQYISIRMARIKL